MSMELQFLWTSLSINLFVDRYVLYGLVCYENMYVLYLFTMRQKQPKQMHVVDYVCNACNSFVSPCKKKYFKIT